MSREWHIGETISNLQSQFSDHSETPQLDAQVLLAEITSQSRAWLLAHPNAKLTSEQHERLIKAANRIQSGIPLPYVLGHWAFYGMDFTITRETLIPRPETELMVEQAIAWLQAHSDQRQAADIGTGSGCIAVSLAVHIPDLAIMAVDMSAAAIQVASENARRHHVSQQIEFIEADLLSLSKPLDVICANLPYIPTETLHQLDVFEREPTMALDGGPDGLALIRRLLPQAQQNLNSPGLLLLEIEATQGASALSLAQEYFPEAQIDLIPDLTRHDRLIRVERINT